MNDEAPDLLTITGTAEKTVEALAADLALIMYSSTLVRRHQDLGRAREVVQLQQDLVTAGLTASDLELKEVYSSTNGTLFKGMSARYRFVVRCTNLDQLPAVLTAIGSQKNTTLSSIEWRYGDEHALHDALLHEALSRANQLARLSAAALGTQIVGVHRVNEAGSAAPWASAAPMLTRSAAKSAPGLAAGGGDSGEIPVLHTRKMLLEVQVQYRIRGWKAPD